MKKQVGIAAGLCMAAMTLVVSDSAEAGGFRRFFQRPCYQQPVYTQQYQQPVQQPGPRVPQAGQPGPQYQSYSFEPGSAPAAAAQPVYSQPSNSGSGYRGTMRYQNGSSVPNMFRGDSKMLGLQRN